MAAPGRSWRRALFAGGLVALELVACRAHPRSAVERLQVTESAPNRRLEGAGVSRRSLEEIARRTFDRTPGFVPSGAALSGVRLFRARVDVQEAEALVGSSDGAVVHLIVAVELSPVDGQPALREQGRAAEPIGAGPGGLKSALEQAAASALERAVGALSLELVAESKGERELIKDLSSPDASVRDHAVRVLGDRGDRAAVPALLARLRDPDPEVAERAVGALAQLRDLRSVPDLIELAHHRDGEYVANLAHIVGDIGGPDARAWLATMAAGHPEEVVRSAAAEALAEMSARTARAGVDGPR
ncbi:MAG TPA: HEAT repeat domain-containing protein [Anaeromyxobacteraceae bacterium]|nr:HEAT repeat domain-containing protein [Anaeromyxobacteraceae bacterium]